MASSGQKANWSKAKFSGKDAKEHSVPVNSNSKSAHLGVMKEKDKKPPRVN